MEAFSRRERQILDILYARGRATAAEIREDLPDPPSYSATRALLRVLEEKGHISHVADGPRYVFMPRVARERAAKSALRHLLQTFFEGSASHAVAALLDVSASSRLRKKASLAVTSEQICSSMLYARRRPTTEWNVQLHLGGAARAAESPAEAAAEDGG